MFKYVWNIATAIGWWWVWSHAPTLPMAIFAILFWIITSIP